MAGWSTDVLTWGLMFAQSVWQEGRWRLGVRRGTRRNASVLARYINDSVRYKPGWQVTASATIRDPAVVTIRAEFDTSDSRDGTPTRVGGTTNIRVRGMRTDQDVWASVFAALLNFELHEIREWFRVEGEAPYHPHVYERKVAFRRSLSGKALRRVMPSLEAEN